MSGTDREVELLRTFADLADTYDVVDLMQILVDRCHELLGATAAGILLVDEFGQLDVVVSTSEASRLVEAMQISAQQGPCIESFYTGATVSVPDVAQARDDWGQFRESSLAQGFHSVHAIPLRLRDTTIGTLNILRDVTGELDPIVAQTAQAFADVATIGIIHERAARESEIVREQLQRALNSRVLIEQAKGFLAHTHAVPVDEAFELLRTYARAHRLSISAAAQGVVDRSLTID